MKKLIIYNKIKSIVIDNDDNCKNIITLLNKSKIVTIDESNDHLFAYKYNKKLSLLNKNDVYLMKYRDEGNINNTVYNFNNIDLVVVKDLTGWKDLTPGLYCLWYDRSWLGMDNLKELADCRLFKVED